MLSTALPVMARLSNFTSELWASFVHRHLLASATEEAAPDDERGGAETDSHEENSK